MASPSNVASSTMSKVVRNDFLPQTSESLIFSKFDFEKKFTMNSCIAIILSKKSQTQTPVNENPSWVLPMLPHW